MLLSVFPALTAAQVNSNDIVQMPFCDRFPNVRHVTVKFTPPATYEYVPALLTIREGDFVTWNFQGLQHSVTESTTDDCSVKPNGFKSGLLSTTYTRQSSQAGTFFYNSQGSNACASGMKGQIVVNTACSAPRHQVSVKFTPPETYEFVPAILNVELGDYVTWNFNGFKQSVSQSNFPDCGLKVRGFNSMRHGLLNTTYSFQFNKAGTFFYNSQAPDACKKGLKGQVVVK
jgi:plastocyanin